METEKTKIGIGLFKNPNGRKEIKAKVWKMQTNTKGIFTFEEKFIELQNNLKKQINITNKKSGDALEHWKLGNMLIEFYDYAEKEGFDFRENTKPLVDYIGKTESFWMLHKKFRRTYVSKEMINQKIPWKMYLLLMRNNDKDRKEYEEGILDGTISDQQELKRRMDLKKNKIKLPLQNQQIVDALCKKDLTREELAIAIGKEPTFSAFGTIRGRISDLNKRYGCNIYKVGDRYHLEKKHDKKNRANKVARKSNTSKNPS